MPIRNKTRNKTRKITRGGYLSNGKIINITEKIIKILEDPACGINIEPDQIQKCTEHMTTPAAKTEIKKILIEAVKGAGTEAANYVFSNVFNYLIRMIISKAPETQSGVPPTTTVPAPVPVPAPVAPVPTPVGGNKTLRNKSLRRKSLVHKKKRCPKYCRRKSVRCVNQENIDKKT